MLYRILHFINEWFALAVLAMYIIAFLMAVSMMFIFPQITLLLFFLGLAGLGIAVVVGKTITGLSHAVARHTLASSTCPNCGSTGSNVFTENDTWRCEHCDAIFHRSGAQIVQQPDVAAGTDAP